MRQDPCALGYMIVLTAEGLSAFQICREGGNSSSWSRSTTALSRPPTARPILCISTLLHSVRGLPFGNGGGRGRDDYCRVLDRRAATSSAATIPGRRQASSGRPRKSTSGRPRQHAGPDVAAREVISVRCQKADGSASGGIAPSRPVDPGEASQATVHSPTVDFGDVSVDFGEPDKTENQ